MGQCQNPSFACLPILRIGRSSVTQRLLLSGLVLVWLLPETNTEAQSPSYYTQAAQLYRNAANQYAAAMCPVQASCMNQNASYDTCLASQYGPNPSNCGPAPTCMSTMPCCPTAPGSKCAGGSGAGSQVPAMTPGQQETQTFVNLGLSIIQALQARKAASAPPAVDTPPPPDPAAIAAAQQQAYNNEAAQLLQEANAMLPSQPGTPAGAPPPDPNTTLDNLLDNGPPTDTSTPEIAALLGNPPTDSSPPTPDPTTTVSDLLTPDTTPSPDLNQTAPTDVVPQNPAMNAAFEESVDQPDPSQTPSLQQMLQGDIPPPALPGEGSDTTATSGTLISNATNDPVIQWAAGGFTTVPLPAVGDSPEQATDKVFGQATLGIAGLIKAWASGPVEFSKELYEYGSKMVEQMGADLGLANAVFNGPDATPSPSSSQ
jgi:hypothetical protein